MQIMILLGLLGILAAAVRMTEKRVRQQTEAAEEVCREGDAVPAEAVERLARAVDGLRAVMAHPQLGGPGYLTVTFPGYGQPEVLAQYPNIQEVLYRRVIRGELERGELTALGVPEELFEQGAEFETESGGMILLRTEVECLPPASIRMLTDHKGRRMVLQTLAAALAEREPDLTVRTIGGDILLTPAARER